LDRENLSGTNIRDLIISDQNWHDFVPEGTKNFLIKNSAKIRLSHL
jgi:nicotinamide-nucleotide adenylyltransferase